ncbi:MAG: LysM peptidoglycan-binding domain-containing protein [Anaerolineales bacterium]
MRHPSAKHIPIRQFAVGCIVLVLLCFWGQQTVRASPGRQDASPTAGPFTVPSTGDLILEVNNLRASYSLPALTIHPALMQVAQAEANGIAADESGHWRPYGLTLGQWLIMEDYPLSGDLTLDGYRSENWSVAFSAQGAIDQIHYWVSSGDEEHTNTMLSADRSDIGVGVATGKNEWGVDQIVFVIETALRTRTGQQQSEANDFLTRLPDIINGGKSINGTPLAPGEYIVPVALSTARPDGDVFHLVRSGQTLWSIAIYYGTTMEQIRRLNNLGEDNTVYEGQRLLVKKGATQPVPTPKESLTPTLPATPKISTPTPTPTSVLLTATPSPGSGAAASPQSGDNSLALGAVFLAFIILVGVIASSLKMKG